MVLLLNVLGIALCYVASRLLGEVDVYIVYFKDKLLFLHFLAKIPVAIFQVFQFFKRKDCYKASVRNTQSRSINNY